MPHPYTLFVVVGEPRTGTNLLTTALSSHPQAIAYGEIFKHESTERMAAKIEPIITRQTRATPYLTQHVFKSYPEAIRAVGFKLLYDQPRVAIWRDAWAYIKNERVTVIHLRRRNLLDRYLSYQQALQSRRWIAFNDKDVSRQETVTLKARECAAAFAASEKRLREVETFFAKSPILNLWYEDIIRLPEISNRKVQSFLNLDYQSIEAKTYKQRTITKPEAITNYQNLKQHLSRGVTQGWVRDEWLDFFDDK